jgi:4-hydroxy-tetrahydrodipicolinate reductase
MPLNILLNGAQGRMGRAIAGAAPDRNAEITGSIDLDDDAAPHVANCAVIIDFSLPEATQGIAELAAANGKPIVIGTTGHSPQEKDSIGALSSKIPMVWAGNYSTGVNLLFHLTRIAAEALGEDFDSEVVEAHHRLKQDAPSGTAERLLEILREGRGLDADSVTHGRSGITGERPRDQIGSHSLRGGDVVGDHMVWFAGEGERIELTHRATDRKIFAEGALRAAHWVVKQSPGLYSMQDVLGLQ